MCTPHSVDSIVLIESHGSHALLLSIAAYRPGVLFPLGGFVGVGLERGPAQDPLPSGTLTGTLTGSSKSPPAEVVLFGKPSRTSL